MTLNTRYMIKSPGGAILLPVIIILSLFTTSCGSWIFDDLPECISTQRLSFRYTKNILNSDAFGSQVSNVNLAIYDAEGKMIRLLYDERQLTEVNDYYLDFDLEPGVYSFLAWCYGQPISDTFSTFDLQDYAESDDLESTSAILPLTAALTKVTGDGLSYSDQDIKPLYYGRLDNIRIDFTEGVNTLPILYLTKDTNMLTVQIQNMFGNPIDPALLEFELQGSNSHLDWQNLPTETPLFTYRPWRLTPTYTLLPSDSSDNSDNSDSSDYSDNSDSSDYSDSSDNSDNSDHSAPSGLQATFTTGRLMADREQYLTVRRTDTHAEILRIPLIEYLMLVRDNYQVDSPQEYLDCNDRYTMVFFIQDDYTWMRARILINGWRVVPPQTGTLPDAS